MGIGSKIGNYVKRQKSESIDLGLGLRVLAYRLKVGTRELSPAELNAIYRDYINGVNDKTEYCETEGSN